MKGQEYYGFEGVSNEAGSVTKRKVPTRVKEARKLGQACASKRCKQIPTQKCHEIEETTRQAIFKNFWEAMDWGQKKIYISSLIKRISPKQTSENSRRKITYAY